MSDAIKTGNEPTKALTPPKTLPLVVDITDAERRQEVTAEAGKALEQLGYNYINPGRMVNLAKLGVALHGVGVVALVHGDAYVAQARMGRVLDILTGMAEDINKDPRGKQKVKQEKILAIAHEIGYLSDKLTRSQVGVLETSGIIGHGGNTAPLPPAPVTPFAAGQAVVPANETKVVAQSGSTVHIHPPEEKK